MISLLPFNKTDYDQLISWVTDEEMLMQFAGPDFNFPLSPEQLELSLIDKNRLAYKIWHTQDEKIIGHAEIYLRGEGMALLSRILIGEKAWRGKGLSQPLVKELLILAFNQPGIEEVSLNVFDWNIPAIKCYKKAGFYVNKAKTKTRCVKDKIWTVLNMRLDKTTWQHLQKAV